MSRLKRELEQLYTSARSVLPSDLINTYKLRQTVRYKNLVKHKTTLALNKINPLVTKAVDSITTQDEWFKNLTTVTFPKNVKRLLALGPKYSLLPTRHDTSIPAFLASTETVIGNLDEEIKNIIIRVTHILTDYMRKPEIGHTLHLMRKETNNFLREHPEIYIIPADKENVTTVMWKEDYNRLSEELLSLQ